MMKTDAEINNFPFVEQQAESRVPPSTEHVFVANDVQLQTLLALQDLRDEVSRLQAIITKQAEKIADLEAAQETLVENQLIQLRLINELRTSAMKEPQPLQKDRAEILRALIAANGGKMLVKDARQKMHLSKQLFSMLIASMKDNIEIKPLHSDNRRKILILRTS